MNYLMKEIKKLPEHLNLEHIRVACHVSKMTIQYYIRSGLLPSISTGKKTRCYTVRKADLLAFLQDYELDPGKYLPPKNWYKSCGHMAAEHDREFAITSLPSTTESQWKSREYYSRKLQNYPDLLNAVHIAEITGYKRHTIAAWCEAHKLKALIYAPKLWIPKEYLLEFLLSNDYNGIHKKSRRHLDDLCSIFANAYGGKTNNDKENQ